MVYSSYYESDERVKPVDPSKPRYDLLDSELQIYGRRYKEMYVLTTPTPSAEREARIRSIDGVLTIVPMGTHIDMLVAGPQEHAISIGKQTSNITGNSVGGLLYQGPIFSQAQVKWAYRNAVRQGKNVCIHNSISYVPSPAGL